MGIKPLPLHSKSETLLLHQRSVLFVCLIDSLCPINNLSVIKRRVFLGWTSTKLGLMFLLKDTTQWRRWGLNPRPFGLESSTLPLSHCATSQVCDNHKILAYFLWYRPPDKCVYLKIVFLFLNKNTCCGYTKEPSQSDSSSEHPKHMFRLLGMKIIAILCSKFCLTGPMLIGSKQTV